MVNAGQMVNFGSIQVEFIHVNHSIPDAVGFGIHTPAGTIVMTGDFKIDTTPIQGEMIDIARFAELGREGVLALLSDSTNAERPGFTASERTVGGSFETLFQRAQNNRIIIATFASNIHRVQQIINCAQKYGRKVALSGRSMLDTKSFVLKTGVRTFEAAAFLRRKGADTVEVKRLFASSFESYQLKYHLIANAQIHRGMAISSTDEPRDLRIEAAQAADELLNISGVEASFVLFPFDGSINISARSFGRINVQIIMEKIGGGGHLTMAGAQLPGESIEQASKKLLGAIDEFSRERGVLAARGPDDTAV